MPQSQLLNQSEQANQIPAKTHQKTTQTTTSPIDKLGAISKLPTFADRGAAIGKALEQIKANPKYQALAPEHQARVRADLYKRTVPGAYKGFNLPVPNEQAWVSATGKSTTNPFQFTSDPHTKLSESFKKSGALEGAAESAMQAFYTSGDKLQLFGAKFNNFIVSTLNGMNHHFTHQNDDAINGARQHPIAKYDAVEVAKRWEDTAKARVQSDTFWMDTHPRETVLGKISEFVGENILTLPLYEAIDTGVLAKAGLTKLAPSLTTKLMASPVGKFVAKRLINATDGYLATYITSGGENKEAVYGAIGFATAGTGTEGGKAVVTKIASAPLIKKWTANVVAMGGIPFAEDLAQSAYAEMQPMDWWLKNGSEAGVKEYKNASMLGKDLAIFPETETKGKFVNTRTNETFQYDGKQEQQLIFDRLHKENLQVRVNEDPVVAKLHEAEKKTFDSIALAKFKKPMEELTPKQRMTAMAIRAKQIREAAAEAVVHAPDLQKAENEESIQAARSQNPELDAAMKDWEVKFGSKFSDTQTENDVTQIAEQTGIKSRRGATAKVIKVAKETEGTPISGEAYASHRADTLAYLRAPRNRKKLVESLGPVGQENWDNFYSELKKMDKSKLQYEKPEHRLLMLYGDRGHLPVTLMHQIERRLKQLDEFKDLPPSKLFEQAKRLHQKVYDMARRGMLDIGSNIYASTKLTGSVAKGDKWTNKLSDEAFKERTRATELALKQHPAALKGFKATANRLQTLSKQAQSADEAAAYTKMLEDFSAGMLDFGSR